MILARIASVRKVIASVLTVIMYVEAILPLRLSALSLNVPFKIMHRSAEKANKLLTGPVIPLEMLPASPAPTTATGYTTVNDGGPTQPEMTSFQSASNDNLVDLFTGDFNYSIPLIDVGGYPLTLGYSSGISMDQEASWVGLGWTLNPGAITRNMRGLPDDFNGLDSITKEVKVEENKTVGVTAGADLELVGFPKDIGGASIGMSLGLFKNSIRGWGMETGVNAGVRLGSKASGALTGGLALSNNSQNGITLTPSLGFEFPGKEMGENGSLNGSFSLSTPYNSRSGMKGMQFSGGIRQSAASEKGSKSKGYNGVSSIGSSSISFVSPSYTPGTALPFTSENVAVTLKVGGAITIAHPSVFISGYQNRQYVAKSDQRSTYAAYGYMNYQNGFTNQSALLDFNRERDIAYREKPAVPNIAVPSYTYDVFAISGEGTGGTFRAYRNDIGYVFDPEVTSRDNTTNASVDLGFGTIVHAGADLGLSRSYTRTALWENDNPMKDAIPFRKTDKNFEAVYFRNPGEKTINAKNFYDGIGGDLLVTAKLNQGSWLSPFISSEARLTPYKNASPQPEVALTAASTIKPAREKRTQVISYLTASEAAEAGLSRYIENYALNTYPDVTVHTKDSKIDFVGKGNGLLATYYHDGGYTFRDSMFTRVEENLFFEDKAAFNRNQTGTQQKLDEYFRAKYEGRLKVPQSGRYIFKTISDDGWSFFLNDEEIFTDMSIHSGYEHFDTLYLEGGKLYKFKFLYLNGPTLAQLKLYWRSEAMGPNPEFQPIAPEYFFLPDTSDVVSSSPIVTMEKRVTSYRKANHISEVSVLNADGRRYVYGIPVYNFGQKEATFAVRQGNANTSSSMVKYNHGVDDAIGGEDKYYSGEIIPAYAHSFLLTGILSPDYVDVTGNGISDDDLGNAIRFNYSKTAGISNPYNWRVPFSDSATYNQGLRSDYRDDKGSYVSGSKELWYLNSVESKNMIAVFKVGERKDQLQISANGVKSVNGAKRLEQIDVYTKADYRKNGIKATPVKTVHFEYSYELCPGINGPGFPADSGKLTLKRVWFSYNGNTKGRSNSYVFNYNKLNPSYNTQNYDRWGNYKDASNNPTSVPGNIVRNQDFPYAIQDSTIAARNAAAWTLDSIILPSGGRLKINYESDDYAFVQNRRAMQMFQVAGLSAQAPDDQNKGSNTLYSFPQGIDYKYISINVSDPAVTKEEVYSKYLEGITKLYFKMAIQVPSDTYGGGFESIPCYARLDLDGGYGSYNSGKTIWVKIKGIDKLGNSNGPLSPLVVTAFNFIKNNLPSKAYPGSENGDNLGAVEAVRLLFNQASNISQMLIGFEAFAKMRALAQRFDPVRSFVRLNNPNYKKLGGGLRVKSLITYDHWNKMTGQRESTYGKEYEYTTTKVVGGKTIEISSGVAAYEPLAGGEENPFRLPIEYQEEVTPLAPVVMGYTEEPLGESFFPSPTVGYSKVRVKPLNKENARSANGFEETCFYTAKDFPVITERTTINNDTKKRFKNNLSDLLKINSMHFLTISQGFKVELNDMHGQFRSKAVYSESDPNNYISYTEYFYHVDDQHASEKHLNNDIATMMPTGRIETSVIGKDVELMVDFREQHTISNSATFSVNSEVFVVGIFPCVIPSLIPMPQREENRFRSVATTKVISRHGIIDSVITIDKGSKVTAQNLIYDQESGNVVLSSMQNEYNDKVYNFTYPAAWIYEGMAGAYKNIGSVFNGIDVTNGKITAGLAGNINNYFFNGDEILVFSKRKVFGTDCDYKLARWPAAYRTWAVDANMLNGGTPDIYFINQDGTPLTGNDMSMKIVRSGRRNISGTGGVITLKRNPVVNGQLQLDNSSEVINASMMTYSQFWKVPDRNVAGVIIDTFRNKQKDTIINVVCGNTTTPVTVTVAANMFSSVVSQEVADDLAAVYLRYNGPYLAGLQSPCQAYWNDLQKASFRKDNCGGGAVGGYVEVIIDPNTISSTISKEDANQKAIAYLNSIGQSRANETGKCWYYSEAQTGTFSRMNCPNNLTPIPVQYTLPAGYDSSDVSQQDANNKAIAHLSAKGQEYANTYGKCRFFARLLFEDLPSETFYESDIHGTKRYTKLSIGFYSDYACSIPYTPSEVTIQLRRDQTMEPYNSSVRLPDEDIEVITDFTIYNSSTYLLAEKALLGLSVTENDLNNSSVVVVYTWVLEQSDDFIVGSN